MAQDQKLFMITTSVQRTDYPDKKWAKFQDTRLVWATDSWSARDKVENFWKDQYESYSHWYEIEFRGVSEAIE